MININNNSYCLTVDKDRYKRLCDNFKQYNIEYPKIIRGYNPEIFSKYIMFKKDHLCSIGHIVILYTALIQELDYCIIFEDDAYCNSSNIHSICNMLISEIDKDNKNWDILFLGYDAIYPGIDPYSNNVVSYQNLINNLRDKYLISETKNCMRLNTNNISGSHALIIKNKCFLKIINKIIKFHYFTDKLYCDSDIITYISKKSLFYQRISENTILRPYYNMYDIDIGPIYKENIV